MATSLFIHAFARLRLRSLLKTSSYRSILHHPEPVFSLSRPLMPLNISNPWWVFKNFRHGIPYLVISEGNPKFETLEVDPPMKRKFLSKKKFKEKLKKKKQKRKSKNPRNPRNLGIKRKKGGKRLVNADERMMYKLEKAKIKEGLLVERLKQYEVPKVQGPLVQPHELTGEERFYMKKMAQKRSNYVPVGKRGVIGGVILNMHLHWKKHETLKVICKPCKPGKVQEYASEIARLSGGTPIQIIGDNTIIFYRGKDYVQPKVMSPIDTLSKKRALEKSKYEESLETVRHFIDIAEKELEFYNRYIALCGDPINWNPNSSFDSPQRGMERSEKVQMIERGHSDTIVTGSSGTQSVSADDDSLENEDGYESGGLSLSELDEDEDDGISSNDDSCDEETEDKHQSASIHKKFCRDSYDV